MIDYLCDLKYYQPMRTLFYLLSLIFLVSACNGTTQKQTRSEQTSVAVKKTEVPVFSKDSAYYYVAKQLSFGPRVPGSEAHAACASWLAATMGSFADTVIVQNFKARVYTKKVFDGKNIIASFNPKAAKRIILAAHWDSRPYADHDPDEKMHRTPIDGANDGASGVGVLMEIARLLRAQPISPSVGIDIIFFDLEDYGPHNSERDAGDDDYWALGSQYWSKTPHQPGYQANFGILLDMVGAAGAVFPREYYSQQYASWVLDKVWRTAQLMGYDSYFSNRPGLPINDDHIPVNRIAGIPMIDIIHQDQNSSNGTFYEHWHTINDNLDQIDKQTLQVVGEVVTRVIYEAS